MNLDQALVTGKGVTLSQAFGIGAETAVIGMGIVFGVLVILMLVLYLFDVIFHRKPKELPEPAAVAEEPIITEEEDDEQLVAVIAAAIAASLNTSTYNLNIKSIKRVSPGRPAWNRAGLTETINNRY